MNIDSALERPVLGILVVYYDKYFESAIQSFTQFIRKNSRRSQIIVVDNAADNRRHRLPPGVDLYVEGDNRLREFSGWNAGLRAASRSGHSLVDSLVVCANDTFCHHNRFGPITANAFSNAMSRSLVAQTPSTLWGERYGLGLSFSVDGLQGHHWVSTHLFGLPIAYWHQNTQLVPERLIAFEPGSFEHLFDHWQASSNLREHVLRWLGQAGDVTTRWYGAASVRDSQSLLIKTACILAEKYVAAQSEAVPALIEDVFAHPVLRMLRKFEPRGKASHE